MYETADPLEDFRLGEISSDFFVCPAEYLSRRTNGLHPVFPPGKALPAGQNIRDGGAD